MHITLFSIQNPLKSKRIAREQVKKLAILADAPDKALTPPPLSCQQTLYFMQVFFTCINIYVFERPEMDDFEEKKLQVLQEKYQYFKKIFRKIVNFFTDILAKKSQNIFAYSFVSEHSKLFFIIRKNFSGGGVGRPPPSYNCLKRILTIFSFSSQFLG